MRQPKPGTLVSNKKAYWETVEEMRPEHNGTLPKWAFEFVGLHSMAGGQLCLTAPMSLVEGNEMKRPQFESLVWPNRKQALAYARMVGRSVGLFVVDCSNQPLA